MQNNNFVPNFEHHVIYPFCNTDTVDNLNLAFSFFSCLFFHDTMHLFKRIMLLREIGRKKKKEIRSLTEKMSMLTKVIPDL